MCEKSDAMCEKSDALFEKSGQLFPKEPNETQFKKEDIIEGDFLKILFLHIFLFHRIICLMPRQHF